MNRPIAIMDSGVGGLTVVQEVLRQLPREEVVYFGDTARCPYGPRDHEQVRAFSYQIIDFLTTFQPKMLVIACNTATAVILEEMRQSMGIPIVGVIHPGVRAAITSTLNGRIGVIGTVGTIKSKLYEQALHQIHPQLFVRSLACPDFVPLVEEGRYDSPQAHAIVAQSLASFQDSGIDTLILGCTHYPLLAPVIQKVMGEKVTLISSADETAREASAIMFHKNILSQKFEVARHRFFSSSETRVFQRIAQSWLNMPVCVTYKRLPEQRYSLK